MERKIQELVVVQCETNSNLVKKDIEVENIRIKVSSNIRLVNTSGGKIERIIKERMEEKLVYAQQHWDNKFTGDKLHSFLTNHQYFTEPIPDEELKKTWNDIFQIFHTISRRYYLSHF